MVFVCDLPEPVALSVARARHRPAKTSSNASTAKQNTAIIHNIAGGLSAACGADVVHGQIQGSSDERDFAAGHRVFFEPPEIPVAALAMGQ